VLRRARGGRSSCVHVVMIGTLGTGAGEASGDKAPRASHDGRRVYTELCRRPNIEIAVDEKANADQRAKKIDKPR